MDRQPIFKEFSAYIKAFAAYFKLRTRQTGLNFEKIKNFVVDVLMVRRGANTYFFIHGSILVLAVVVLVGGGILSSTSVVSGSYPGVPANPLVAGAATGPEDGGVISSSITPVTIISDKPRDKAVEYEVKSGDTIE